MAGSARVAPDRTECVQAKDELESIGFLMCQAPAKHPLAAVSTKLDKLGKTRANSIQELGLLC